MSYSSAATPGPSVGGPTTTSTSESTTTAFVPPIQELDPEKGTIMVTSTGATLHPAADRSAILRGMDHVLVSYADSFFPELAQYVQPEITDGDAQSYAPFVLVPVPNSSSAATGIRMQNDGANSTHMLVAGRGSREVGQGATM